jgi:predicted GIY-YIG superfamily endonuclease
MSKKTGVVYLIHFEQPFGTANPARTNRKRPYKPHARHYCGWASKLIDRVRQHAQGQGSALLRAVNKAGIGWQVVRTWKEADRHLERKIKNTHSLPKYCPVCREAKKNLRNL